jgi:hypothetical protein
MSLKGESEKKMVEGENGDMLRKGRRIEDLHAQADGAVVDAVGVGQRKRAMVHAPVHALDGVGDVPVAVHVHEAAGHQPDHLCRETEQRKSGEEKQEEQKVHGGRSRDENVRGNGARREGREAGIRRFEEVHEERRERRGNEKE